MWVYAPYTPYTKQKSVISKQSQFEICQSEGPGNGANYKKVVLRGDFVILDFYTLDRWPGLLLKRRKKTYFLHKI